MKQMFPFLVLGFPESLVELWRRMNEITSGNMHSPAGACINEQA